MSSKLQFLNRFDRHREYLYYR